MKTLYHYTSLDTFLKIVQGESIRLSDLGQSNDTHEGLYVLDHLKKAIRSSTIPAQLHEILYEVLEDFLTYSGALGFCLSEKPDQLSQWRGYGDDGHGICIGFDATKLESAGQNTSHMLRHAKIVPVNYGEKRTRGIQQSLISALNQIELCSSNYENFITEITEYILIESPNETAVTTAATEAWVAISNATATAFEHKSTSFEEEAEHRILVDHSTSRYEDQIEYSTIRNRLVAYKDANFDDSLTDVVIGPKCAVAEKEIRQVLRRYLKGNRFRFVKDKVRRSASTYR